MSFWKDRHISVRTKTTKVKQKRKFVSAEEAAIFIQKWIRNVMRTQRFLQVVRRGLGRRKRLQEREKLSKKLYTVENEAEEMKVAFMNPEGGAAAVNKMLLNWRLHENSNKWR